MKNTLVDLQNHLISVIEKLNDDDLKGEKLDEEISRAIAINEVAMTAVRNGLAMIQAANTLYGLPVSDELPLIPKSPVEKPVIVADKRKALHELPNGMTRKLK